MRKEAAKVRAELNDQPRCLRGQHRCAALWRIALAVRIRRWRLARRLEERAEKGGMEADDLDGVGSEAGGGGTADGGRAAGPEPSSSKEGERTIGRGRAGLGSRPLRVGNTSDG